MQSIHSQYETRSSSSQVAPQYETASNLYMRVFRDLQVSNNYPATLASILTEESLNSLDPKDRPAHRVFMATFLPIKNFTELQKSHLNTLLRLLTNQCVFPQEASTSVDAVLRADKPATSPKRSKRTPKYTEEYQEFINSQTAQKRSRKEEVPTSPSISQVSSFLPLLQSPESELIGTPSEVLTPGSHLANSGITNLINALSPKTRQEVIENLAIDFGVFDS
jgi:hypothetical protein